MHIEHQCLKQQHIIREHQPVYVYNVFIFYDTSRGLVSSVQSSPTLENKAASFITSNGNFHFCHVHQRILLSWC